MSAASRREDCRLIAPKNLKRPAAEKLAAKLLAAGLVREIKAKSYMPVWRRDGEAGRAFSLKLTVAGLKFTAISEDDTMPEESVGAAPGEDGSNAEGAANPALAEIGATTGIVATAPRSPAPNGTPAPVSSTPRQGTKIARVIELLQREEGATLESMIVATGWLPHTARAALTGLRHRGCDVRLERGEKGKRLGLPDRRLGHDGLVSEMRASAKRTGRSPMKSSAADLDEAAAGMRGGLATRGVKSPMD